MNRKQADPAQVRSWLEESTRTFLDLVEALPDAAFAMPSALPEWTRGHVIAHVHFNAVALLRLVEWARTGREQRMYPSAEQRATEIAQGARLPPARLRELVASSAAELAERFDALSPAQLAAPVVTAQGRTIPAAGIAWLRTRETAVHAIDLDAGVSFADLGDGLNHALAADALARHGLAGHLPGLAAWLTGRSPQPPRLGRWL